MLYGKALWRSITCGCAPSVINRGSRAIRGSPLRVRANNAAKITRDRRGRRPRRPVWHDGGCANNVATCKPFAPSCHPERGNKAEPRDLDRAKNARARCEYTKLFLAKMLLPAIEVQRFCLDPASASPCGLLARQSLASQTSTPLRCAQDDTDGMLVGDAGDS